MKENTTQSVTQFDRAEALDRIHVIQTMMCELLWMWEGNYPAHKGLSELAAYHVQEAMDGLAKAYQNQGLYVFEEDENVDDDYTSGNSEMGRRMQSNLQKLVAAGKVNLEALNRFRELKGKDDDAS